MVPVTYSQTAAKSALPGGDEAIERYMERTSSQILHDIADGYNLVAIPAGLATMDVSDHREAGSHVINYPSGRWVAPGGLGTVNVTGPRVEVVIEEAAAGEPPPRSVPRGLAAQWHRARCRALSRLANGEGICQVALKLPLMSEIRFNVTISADFVMECGFAGSGGAEDGQVTVGLDGRFGVSPPRLPGAETLLSVFLPSYCHRNMQRAADGLARTFHGLRS